MDGWQIGQIQCIESNSQRLGRRDFGRHDFSVMILAVTTLAVMILIRSGLLEVTEFLGFQRLGFPFSRMPNLPVF
jgi:hypothetical protein